MRGELKGVFILFKLTSLPTHWGVPGEETERAGEWDWGGGGGLCVQHSNTRTHTHNAYANHCEF